jgi:hypothetical protein
MSRTTSHQSSPMAGVYAVSDNKVVLVVGLGEVGKPLLAILSQR